MAMLSVILPVYNGARFLDEAVRSILGQTYSDFELLLLDDCSTDNTKEIIEQFAVLDKRVLPIFNEKNLGLPQSLNKAMRKATGKYIARMDADDIARPERFRKQIDHLESHPEIDLLGSWWEYFPGKLIMRMPSSHDDIKLMALHNNPIGHPTVMFRREKMFNEVGFYDETAFPVEDYEYWIRGIQKITFANLPEVLLDYRIHSAQTSFEKSKQQAEASRKLRANFIRPLTYSVESSLRIIDFLDGYRDQNNSKIRIMIDLSYFYFSNFLFGSFARRQLASTMVGTLRK